MIKISKRMVDSIKRTGKYETSKFEYRTTVNMYGEYVIVKRQKGNEYASWKVIGKWVFTDD